MQIFLSHLEELPLHLCCLWVRCPMSSARRWWKVCLTVLSAVCLCWTALSSLALSTLSSAPSQKKVHMLLCCSVALSLQNVLQNEIYWKTFCISISCTYNSRLLYLWNTPGSEYSYCCECPFSHGISVNMILWFSIYTLNSICTCPSSTLPSRRACFATVFGTLLANQWNMILHVDVRAACHCYTKSWKDTPPLSAFSLHSEYTICYLPPPSPPPATPTGGGGGVLLHVASSLQAYLRLALVHLGLQQWQQKVATGQVACHLRVRQHMHKPHTSVHTYLHTG